MKIAKIIELNRSWKRKPDQHEPSENRNPSESRRDRAHRRNRAALADAARPGPGAAEIAPAGQCSRADTRPLRTRRSLQRGAAPARLPDERDEQRRLPDLDEQADGAEVLH